MATTPEHALQWLLDADIPDPTSDAWSAYELEVRKRGRYLAAWDIDLTTFLADLILIRSAADHAAYPTEHQRLYEAWAHIRGCARHWGLSHIADMVP